MLHQAGYGSVLIPPAQIFDITDAFFFLKGFSDKFCAVLRLRLLHLKCTGAFLLKIVVERVKVLLHFIIFSKVGSLLFVRIIGTKSLPPPIHDLSDDLCAVILI